MDMAVREISRLTGISVDSLRYYDRESVVSPKRRRNKYRYYDERDLILLQYVAVMKYAQFSLSDIKTVMRSADEEPSEECARRNIELLRSKREELSGKIANFKKIIKLLDEAVSLLESGGGYEEKEKIMDRRIQEVFSGLRKQDVE